MKKLISFFALGIFLSAAPSAHAACTITVTNTADSGAGSLRQAILDANGTGGIDTICFNIPGSGVQTIQPLSALPDVTGPLVVDGYTQPGASPNTAASGDDAVLLIEIDGSLAGNVVFGALVFQTAASGSTIQGLVINRFQGSGIYLTGSDSNVVQGNFIGPDATGNQNFGNTQTGVAIVLGSDNNLIGGSTPASRNLISGNSSDVQIGGGGGEGNLIQGNLIGTDRNGTSGIGNPKGGGIVIFDSNNQVGGTIQGSGNVIAFNKFAGIAVVDDSPPAIRTFNVSILGNSIFSNNDLGIALALQGEPDPGVTLNDLLDADDGPNRLQNFPELNSAILRLSQVEIQGTLSAAANTTFRIEFFANDACDPSGYGEGQTFLGFLSVTTDGSGNAGLFLSLPASGGPFLTATATDPDGNISEFSKCVESKPSEICNNGADDDGDGQSDCADAECADLSSCQGNTPAPESGGCRLSASAGAPFTPSALCLVGFLTLGLLVAARRPSF